MEEVKTALVYCRVATMKDNTFSESLENQLSKCSSKVFLDGYKRCECVVEVGSGLSKKSKTIKRLRRIKKLARSQKFDVLYVTNLTRLTRDFHVISELLDYFDKYQIRVEIIE